ncbi:hypothetical protein QWJ26_13150 [Streptomyces sp. CSDS2]|uniref:hypothetical protein n=1 Tax=Streptomyces sp. CSDS2 TaxID=3055051 RepID=UPI0025B24461|nr:hypothetical protein [Streptomyces sp. CSDS2]MDN3260744.1 hypothetical protein [Streptomyces sp. CSDS2]
MAYELRAVIAEDGLLRGVARDVAGARVVALRQGLSLLPMTDELVDARAGAGGTEVLGFQRLPAGFERTLAGWSVAGSLAYVEVESFGGVGEERAAVWAGGGLVLGPLDVPVKRWFSWPVGPVSQALRRLGARGGRGGDAFDAVGLDRHRWTEDWAASGAG